MWSSVHHACGMAALQVCYMRLQHALDVERTALQHSGEDPSWRSWELALTRWNHLGKPESYVMVSIQPSTPLVFGGSDGPAAFVRLRFVGLAAASWPRPTRFGDCVGSCAAPRPARVGECIGSAAAARPRPARVDDCAGSGAAPRPWPARVVDCVGSAAAPRGWRRY